MHSFLQNPLMQPESMEMGGTEVPGAQLWLGQGCSHVHQCRCTHTQVVPTAQHRIRTFLLRSPCWLCRRSQCQQIDVKAEEEGKLQQCWKLFRKMLTQRVSVVTTKNLQRFPARFDGSFAAVTSRSGTKPFRRIAKRTSKLKRAV